MLVSGLSTPQKYTGSQLCEAERGFDLGARVQDMELQSKMGPQQPFKIM
jgi:hypothetical protein